MAEAAYVRCKDYPGIQFTKRLSRIQNETIKRAEVAAWFRNFDEAEKLFLDVDRRDLAVAMRKRLGDWFKVVQLLKTGSGGNDAEMEEAYNEVNMCRMNVFFVRVTCFSAFMKLNILSPYYSQ